MRILLHYFIFFFLIIFSFGQVKDPETGELVNLKYDKKSGSYYLFGLDKMELLDNNVFKGKFMGASDSLVLFKAELDGGKFLEQEIASIKNLVLESYQNRLATFHICPVHCCTNPWLQPAR